MGSGIGNALLGSLLAWVVLGNRTRVMTKHLGVSTMPEFFEKRYDSKALKTAAALIVFLFLIPYTASVYNGLSTLFASAFPSVPYAVWIGIMAAFTAVYVILGGYMATAVNDFLQGIVMLVGISAVVVCAVNTQGGLGNVISQLGQIDAGSAYGTYNSVLGPDPLNLIGVVILTSLGTWGLPQMVQKFYAIKDKAAVRRGSLISTLFAVIVAGGSYFLGGLGRLYCTTDPAESGKTLIDTLANGNPNFDSIVPAILDRAIPEILLGARHRTGFISLHEYAGRTRSFLQFHADDRSNQALPEKRHDAEKTGLNHAYFYCHIPADFGLDCHQ